jgi:hypothetical protein
MTPPVTMQSAVMLRSGDMIPAVDDAAGVPPAAQRCGGRSGAEERR